MKAALFKALGEMEIIEMARPACPEGGLLLKVEACTICGTDVRIFRHGKSNVKMPGVLGHEVAGVVTEVAAGVTAYRPDQRVVVMPGFPCMTCEHCARGEQMYCKNSKSLGYSVQGGYAEYVAIPAQGLRGGAVMPIADHLPFHHAAVTEPLGCVLKGHRLTRTGIGDRVVVMGAGPIGGMHVLVARLRGASQVILVDVNNSRLELSRRFKADAYINSLEEDLVKRVLDETAGRGADVVITANSAPIAQEQALQLAAPHGRVLYFGGLPPQSSVIRFDSNILHYKELEVLGTFGSSLKDNDLALRLLTTGQVPGELVVSHCIPLTQVVAGIGMVEAGTALRVALLPQMQ